MGKNKQGFNWKARQQGQTVVDHSDEKKIKLDSTYVIDKTAVSGYDESNSLVLPSRKRKTEKKKEVVHHVKKLSKKERKTLEKVLEKREKKSKRAQILESLSEVQATSEEMKLFTSITEMHSQKFKHKLDIELSPMGEVKLNSITGSKKNMREQKMMELEKGQDIDGDESDSSIDTSDISTDEEQDVQPTQDDDKQIEETPANSSVIETAESTRPDDSSVEKPKDASSDNIAIKDDTKVGKTTESDTQVDTKPAFFVPVSRSAAVQAARLKLPILGEEQVVMEAIHEHPVVIICGETGSGKTTQVPQFLYEAGYAHKGAIIGITEPRRVAAISMSRRVAMEMNLSRRVVSYQIRYEGNTTDETKIKFQTDGVLLKEVQKDFLLTKYSVIIIDEAHERSVYTDILIGLLSRIVPLRQKRGNPLKLIIMSATLRVEDFTDNKRLFKVTPPVIKVDSRQYPVTIHFNKRTPLDDYLSDTYKKICKIHRQLPEGGILVFVTGQQEVHTLCRKLKHTFPYKQGTVSESKPKPESRRQKKTKVKKCELPEVNLNNYSTQPLDEEADLDMVDQESDDDITLTSPVDDDDDNQDDVENTTASEDPLYVLPLYSLLSSEKQAKVFESPPGNCRLCVVSTNVAETSLTIPNIKYVVDTGKVKTKFYDKVTGVSTFRIMWTSQASANQRAGRAGRVSPGHCYRLYSSAVFNDDFEKFSPPEITRRPVDDLVLQMKDMNINKVINFPFPTPPDIEQIKAAEKLLTALGALTHPDLPRSVAEMKKESTSTITPVGRAMSKFPVSPRYAKMLLLGEQHDLLPYVITVVSALSVDELFTDVHKSGQTDQEKDDFKQKVSRSLQVRKLWAGSGNSLLLGDLMVLLKAVGSCEYEGFSTEFCDKFGLRSKAMKEIRKLRVQLTNTVNVVLSGANVCVDPKLSPPSDVQCKLLRQIVLTGLADHVARRYADPPPGADEAAKKLKNAYQSMDLEEPVYIHPLSVLYREKPEFVVYQHVIETSKMYMRGVVAIDPEWLPVFAPFYCTLGKPLEKPPPEFDQVKGHVTCHMTSSYGPLRWSIDAVSLEFPSGLERFKWFAKFLLEGAVVTRLQKYVPSLLSTPSTMVKSWAKLQPRTESLLKALVSEGVDNRDSLLRAWKQNPKYLLSAYCEWLPQGTHMELETKWPPVDST
ncbi:probable ATP-dependent RNA helicase DHX37 [Gigantopelta aegis]|uniref:probable ATP-dependent RNA helicase DHX37 n=1 Tax=Gigantopelta aegis TaxID=1735272 RepID=UPI001B88BB8E|nr:probable ATP-dependent RNA helicase DHX37 [Gigantopelta aegis]